MNDDIIEISDLIYSGYVRDVLNNSNEKVRSQVFHKDFRMFFKDGDELDFVTLEEWRDQITHHNQSNPDESLSIKGSIEHIAINSYTASVKLYLSVVRSNRTYSVTDFLQLIKLKGKWMIVSKIFSNDPPVLMD